MCLSSSPLKSSESVPLQSYCAESLPPIPQSQGHPPALRLAAHLTLNRGIMRSGLYFDPFVVVLRQMHLVINGLWSVKEEFGGQWSGMLQLITYTQSNPAPFWKMVDVQFSLTGRLNYKMGLRQQAQKADDEAGCQA
ncbi:unnamed protein product [Leuciscus chuanchicus]